MKTRKRKKTLKIALISISILFLGILIYMFSWRLFGFKGCDDPTVVKVYSIEIKDNLLILKGGAWYGLQKYAGYTSKQDGLTVTFGIKTRLFLTTGTRDFELKIPLHKTVNRIVISGANWSELGKVKEAVVYSVAPENFGSERIRAEMGGRLNDAAARFMNADSDDAEPGYYLQALMKGQTQYVPGLFLNHYAVGAIDIAQDKSSSAFSVDYLPDRQASEPIAVNNYEFFEATLDYQSVFTPNDLPESYKEYSDKGDTFYCSIDPASDGRLKFNYYYFFDNNVCFVAAYINDVKEKTNEQLAEQLHRDLKCVVWVDCDFP